MGKKVNNVLGWLRSYSQSGEGKQAIFGEGEGAYYPLNLFKSQSF